MSTITLGLDLGDRASRYAVLDADAHLVGEGSVATTREAMQDFFSALPTARVIFEVVAGLGEARDNSYSPLATGAP